MLYSSIDMSGVTPLFPLGGDISQDCIYPCSSCYFWSEKKKQAPKPKNKTTAKNPDASQESRHENNVLFYFSFYHYLSYSFYLLLCRDTMIKKHAGEERVSSGRSWCRDCGGALLSGLLGLLSYRTKDHQPRDSTTHKGLGPPPWSLIKKRVYSWILWGHFLN